MNWIVETSGTSVDAEIAALPADMQAALLRLAERIEAVGLARIEQPHLRQLKDKLWEIRLSGRDGIVWALNVTAKTRSRAVIEQVFVRKIQKTPRGHYAVGRTDGTGDQIMTSLAKLRQLLTDPEVKAEYDRLGPIFAVIGEMVEARQAAGLTQADIALRMGTSQSVVARLENARHMPSFDMVARYAAAVDRRLDIHLVPNAENAAGSVT